MTMLNKRAPGMGSAVACIILDYVRHGQGNAQDFLRGTGLDLQALHSGNCDVSLEQEITLIRNVIADEKNPFMLGFNIGLQYSIASLGMLGMAMVTSTDIMAAVQIATRYLLHTEHLTKVGLFIKQQDFIVTLSCDPEFSAREEEFLIGRELGIIVAIQQQLIPQQNRQVQRIDLIFPPIDGMDKVAQMYDCEVFTGCDKNQIITNAAQLLMPMPLQNSYVAGLCEAQINAAPQEPAAQENIAKEDLRKKLRERINSSLPVVLSTNEIAQEMHMSSRTFSRLLEKENISWRDYLTECRLNYAQDLLAKGVSIKQAAERAGFSSSSSFSHAFSRCMGISPGEYIRQKS